MLTKVAFNGSKILLSGYAAFAAFFVLFPFVISAPDISFSSKRIGSADSFTIIFTHLIFVVSLAVVFWVKSVDAVITPHSIKAWVSGAIMEASGWIAQRVFWQPWYIYKEVSNSDSSTSWIPLFLEQNVWILTFAYAAIWIGVGLQMNIVFRTIMGDHYHWWPIAWLSVVISAWIAGFYLPDLVAAIHV